MRGKYIHMIVWPREDTQCAGGAAKTHSKNCLYSEYRVKKPRCINVPAGCVQKMLSVCVRGKWWLQAFCQQEDWGTEEHKDGGYPAGQDASLQRDTSSEVNIGTFRE